MSQAFVERVANMQNKTDGHLHQLIRNRLDAVRKAYSYESVLLLDTEGQPLLVLGEQHKLSAVTKALLPVALADKPKYRAAICSWTRMAKPSWISWCLWFPRPSANRLLQW